MKGNPMKKIILSAIALFLLIGGIGLAQPTRRSGSSPIERGSPVLWNSDGSIYLTPNVGVGTTSASHALEVAGDIYATGDVAGSTLTAGGIGSASRIDFSANNTYLESLGIGGIYLGDSDITSFTRLDVDGFIYADKNVGIGTTAATAFVDIVQTGTGYLNALLVRNTGDPGTGATKLTVSNSVSSIIMGAYGSSAPAGLTSFAVITSGTAAGLTVGAGSGQAFRLFSNNLYATPEVTLNAGNVGIGSISPRAKLDIEGAVYISETGVAGAGAAMVVCRCSNGLLGHVTGGTVTSPTCVCP